MSREKLCVSRKLETIQEKMVRAMYDMIIGLGKITAAQKRITTLLIGTIEKRKIMYQEKEKEILEKEGKERYEEKMKEFMKSK